MEASRRRLGPMKLVGASAVRARPVRAGRVMLAAALLAVGAVGPFGPGAGPAMAVDGEPDNTARYSACVGAAATTPAGFVDTADIFAEDAINCLAYYKITKGTSSGAFSPGNSVSRWQMALFLVRAAEAAGLALPEARDQGFEDIGTLGPSTREAVNRLAQLGITRGTGEGRFSPYGPVSRQQMALFLYRFLGEIPIGEGGVEVSEVAPDDTVFEDISPLSGAVEQAIMVLYEMGVTSGTSEGRFSPNERVSRSQMALFIARALNHSNARPAGVTIQVDRSGRSSVPAGDTINLHFSVRDQDRRSVAAVPLDIFSISLRRWDVAFDARGNCTREVSAVPTGQICQIDRLDRRTDDLGNVFVAVELSESTVFWAWTGAHNDIYRDGVTEAGQLEIAVSRPSASLVVEDDMRRGASRLRLGDSVTFTMQLVDDTGSPVTEGGVGVRVSSRIDVGGVTGRTEIKTYPTDRFGRVSLTFRQQDPDTSSQSGDDWAALVMEVSAPGREVVDRTVSRVLTGENALLRWVEEEARPSELKLSQGRAYHLVSAAGPGVAHLVTAVLTDQYGDPVEGVRLEFTSDDSRGVGSVAKSRVTDSQGAALLRYLRDGTTPGSETITVQVPDSRVRAERIRHHWAVPHNESGSLGAELLASDVNDDLIVLNPGFPALVRYDSNDVFTVDGRDRTLAEFEAALRSGNYTRVSFHSYSADRSVRNSFELSNVRIYDNA